MYTWAHPLDVVLKFQSVTNWKRNADPESAAAAYQLCDMFLDRNTSWQWFVLFAGDCLRCVFTFLRFLYLGIRSPSSLVNCNCLDGWANCDAQTLWSLRLQSYYGVLKEELWPSKFNNVSDFGSTVPGGNVIGGAVGVSWCSMGGWNYFFFALLPAYLRCTKF